MADLEAAAADSLSDNGANDASDVCDPAAAAALERAGDDAKSMSLDEFRHEMFRSLRDSGTVEAIRVRSLTHSLASLRSPYHAALPWRLLPPQRPLTNALTLTIPPLRRVR